MKLLPLLVLSLLCTSCALIQLPARIINSALGPLTEAETPNATPATAQVALKVDAPARHAANPKN